MNWIEHHKFLDEQFMYRYFTSLHWSITQFTPGSMHVQPQNTGERIFAVTVLLFGMIIFSSFVSSMTSAMTSLRQITSGSSKQTWILRKYLRENAVPLSLRYRILRFVDHEQTQQEDAIPESRVTLLTMLSEQLRVELRVSTTMAPITVHPVFAQIHDHAAFTIQHIVRQAVTIKNLAMGDTCFLNKQPASCMYVVASGSLSYSHYGTYNRLQRSIRVEKTVWVSEAVLWTPWVHVGTLQAVTECRLLSISEEQFGKVILTHVKPCEMAKTHANDFVNWLNNYKDEGLTDLPCGDGYNTMMSILAGRNPNHRSSLLKQVCKIQESEVED